MRVKLGDICEINPKRTPEDLDMNVSFIPMQRVSDQGDIDTSDIRSIKKVCKGFTAFVDGDILMAKITPCMENGKGAIASGLHNGIGYGSTEFHVLRPNQDLVRSSWIYYFTIEKLFRLNCEKNMTGSAGQKRVPKSYLQGYPIPLPSLAEQDMKIATLDRLRQIIILNKSQLQKLDELVKCRFIEMFGDPVDNPRGWETKGLLELGKCKNGMNFSAGESGVNVHCLGVGDFKDYSEICNTSVLPKIPLNKMPPEEVMLQDGDIVFVRSNGNKMLVGRCLVIFPGDIPTTYSGFCIRFRKEAECVDTTYLVQLLKADSTRSKMAGRGANIQNLNQQILGALQIPIPPIELQQEFKDFINQTDKSKLAVQQALDKTQQLFDSLMQQYFA